MVSLVAAMALLMLAVLAIPALAQGPRGNAASGDGICDGSGDQVRAGLRAQLGYGEEGDGICDCQYACVDADGDGLGDGCGDQPRSRTQTRLAR